MLLSKLLVSIPKLDKISSHTKLYIKKLEKKIGLLHEIKNTKNYKLIRKNLQLKSKKFDLGIKQNLIKYIINIRFSETNTLVNITDIKGNPKVTFSSGIVHLKGKQKKHQPTALVKILKTMFSKIKFISTEPVALHFVRAKRFHIFLAINLLKSKVFIRTIRNYNLKPYNGCRPRKIRRIKKRSK